MGPLAEKALVYGRIVTLSLLTLLLAAILVIVLQFIIMVMAG